MDKARLDCTMNSQERTKARMVGRRRERTGTSVDYIERTFSIRRVENCPRPFSKRHKMSQQGKHLQGTELCAQETCVREHLGYYGDVKPKLNALYSILVLPTMYPQDPSGQILVQSRP